MQYNPINIQRTLPLSRHGRHAQAPQVTLLDLGPLHHGEDGHALGSVRVCKILSLTAGTSANLSPCTTLAIFRVSLCQVGDYIRGLPDNQRFYVKFQSACSNLPAKSTRESLSDWAERRVAVLRSLLLVAVCPTCVPVAA